MEGFRDTLNGGVDREECVEVFMESLRLVNNAIDVIYEGTICPLSFIVGATGLMPESVATQALTAKQLVEKFPGVKLSKAEKEGTFYMANGLLLSVFTQAVHFSTESGAKAASDLSA